jgi:hypothetical protein
MLARALAVKGKRPRSGAWTSRQSVGPGNSEGRGAEREASGADAMRRRQSAERPGGDSFDRASRKARKQHVRKTR